MPSPRLCDPDRQLMRNTSATDPDDGPPTSAAWERPLAASSAWRRNGTTSDPSVSAVTCTPIRSRARVVERRTAGSSSTTSTWSRDPSGRAHGGRWLGSAKAAAAAAPSPRLLGPLPWGREVPVSLDLPVSARSCARARRRSARCALERADTDLAVETSPRELPAAARRLRAMAGESAISPSAAAVGILRPVRCERSAAAASTGGREASAVRAAPASRAAPGLSSRAPGRRQPRGPTTNAGSGPSACGHATVSPCWGLRPAPPTADPAVRSATHLPPPCAVRKSAAWSLRGTPASGRSPPPPGAAETVERSGGTPLAPLPAPRVLSRARPLLAVAECGAAVVPPRLPRKKAPVAAVGGDADAPSALARLLCHSTPSTGKDRYCLSRVRPAP
mmetsp:Transcript_24689/g.93377  ORF Transcript_24689/g.93377 Transcript_24689/m.93377 type:complete len:391 (+) Transcript_24689:742-1914(+)